MNLKYRTNFILRVVCVVVEAIFSHGVMAAPPIGPVYADGPCKGLHQDECEATQKYRQKQADEKAAQELAWQKTLNEIAEEKRAKSDAAERVKAESVTNDAKRAAESKEYWAKENAHKDAEAKAEAAAARRANEAAGVQKANCGADYKKPRIGMTMARVQECVSTSFKEQGQTNTEHGIVTTYRAPGGYLHVIDGKVVQWGRF
jgi:hypothetical protein